jgi:hypothetical protein
VGDVVQVVCRVQAAPPCPLRVLVRLRNKYSSLSCPCARNPDVYCACTANTVLSNAAAPINPVLSNAHVQEIWYSNAPYQKAGSHAMRRKKKQFGPLMPENRLSNLLIS